MERDRKVMKQNSGRGYLWLCLFVVLLLTSFMLWKQQARAERPAIRVGYIDYNGFIEENNGNYSGYGVDYLEKIAEYTGWRYEYSYDTWANCLEKLENGQLDLLCTAQYTQERAERFLYADIPLGYESVILYVPEDSNIYYEEYMAMEGIRVGLLTDSFQTQAFYELAEEKGISFEAVYFDTEAQIMEALGEKSIDMAAVGSLSYHTGVKAVGRYGAEAFYCITGKDNKGMMEKLNEALRQIKIDAPSLETELTQKYYGDSSLSSNPLFTREEYAYIQQAEPVKVRLMDGTIPLSYEGDGENAGILVEFLKLIEEKSGLQFEIEATIFPGAMDAQMEQMREEDYLMIRSKRALEYSGLDGQLVSSIPLFETSLAYVRRQKEDFVSDRDDYVFALTPEMEYLEELLYSDSPQFQINYYGTPEECMEAVIKREADIAIQDSYTTTYLLQKPIYKDHLLEGNGVQLKNGVCLIGAEENQLLINIINKTINFISEEEAAEIIARETLMNPYQQTGSDILYEYRFMLLGVAICLVFAGIICALLLRYMTNLKIEKREYEILQKRVQQDELTGIYSRQSFFEKARAMIDSTTENMCIAIMDISNFKVVNDLYGIESGDRLLKDMAQELKKLCGKCDFAVARFTGDHFYMCMRHEDFLEIHFPRRFKTFLEDMDITVIYGVFVVEDQKDVPINIMCDRASLAAHDKERQQIGYIRYYSDEERKRILQDQEIENDMEKALEARQFCVYIQPKYDVYTGKIVGGESLVRWKHPQKGMIPPGSFISIFERNGFIFRLDYFVWEETCRLIAELKKKGIQAHPISINVSRAHLYGKELRDKLQELIGKYQLQPEELELEITETICGEDPEIIYKRIAELQKAGFKVAMDDFGSGYSSLNMLKEMPLDIIKMDLKFLDGGEDVEKSHSILKTLIALAHSLNLAVVVEGVETEAQVEFLKEAGNHYVQGYYFSRPVDCETYEEMLKQEERDDTV